MMTALDRYSLMEWVELTSLTSVRNATRGRNASVTNPRTYVRRAKEYHDNHDVKLSTLTTQNTYIKDGDIRFFLGTNVFLHAMEMPFEDIPKYLNSPNGLMVEICKWRLEKGR